MTKKATIILSSPRKGSNSSALALAIGAGVTEAGGAVDTADLSGLDIKPCLACDACQRNGGKCSQLDGMYAVYPKITVADILILASPIYFFNVCGQLKVFLDRCIAVAGSPGGPFSKKTIAAALAFGSDDILTSGVINVVRSLQDICAYSGAKWGGAVYGSATDRDALAKDEELLDKARALGAELAR